MFTILGTLESVLMTKPLGITDLIALLKPKLHELRTFSLTWVDQVEHVPIFLDQIKSQKPNVRPTGQKSKVVLI